MSDSNHKLNDMDVVHEGANWPHGDAVVQQLLERCNESEVLQVVDELIEHVRTMGIASRFRSDRYANQLCAIDETNPRLQLVDYTFGNGKKLSEVGHKRATLLIELQRIQNDLAILFSKLATLRREIEVTNMELDGSHVPKPSPEELHNQNTFQGPENS